MQWMDWVATQYKLLERILKKDTELIVNDFDSCKSTGFSL